MKRVLLCVTLALCLVLSACNEPPVNGPGDISVMDGFREPIRMIKVDGKLYYDSGEVSDVTARCGTLDGNLKQVGKDYEIPRNDGECNFSGAEGYQRVTSITREVPIDGKWVIFKLFDDPELDMSVFDYCFLLGGRLPNAKTDSKLVILTEDEDYTFDTFYKQVFGSQFNPETIRKQTTFRVYGETDGWGLTLSVKDVTETGATLVFEQFGGMPTGELQTGSAFALEKNVDDEWVALEPNAEDLVWTAIAYMIRKNDRTEMPVTWEFIYGPLEKGYYRLNKEVTDFRVAGDFDKQLYHAYFTIE